MAEAVAKAATRKDTVVTRTEAFLRGPPSFHLGHFLEFNLKTLLLRTTPWCAFFL